ncbi:MAG: nucleotidyltransferase family protein [Nocardioidaceae bacterium]|nr:MAG: nucleotidyltransferase family protein [Nocardioidaceae bacterium]
MTVIGLLLAAGQGRRMGRPKALVRGEDGVPWVVSSSSVLAEAGCQEVLVVLGAQAEQAAALLETASTGTGSAGTGRTRIRHVVAPDWADGMSASLRAGLTAIKDTTHDAALVHLVDLPDVGADVVRRLLARAERSTLARAGYHGVPGHPVLIGREHWAPLTQVLSGDEGAKRYLRSHQTDLVESGDLATGHDVDQMSDN